MKSHALLSRVIGFCCLFFCLSIAQAQIEVKITKKVANAIPVIISPFAGTSPIDFSSIIAADLMRSGRFQVISQVPQQLASLEGFQPESWRNAGASYVALGNIRDGGSGFQVSFQLGDTAQGQQLLGMNYQPRNEAQLRRTAHQIADKIFEQLTGEPGASDTRLAYVNKVGNQYTLVVSDADGFNPQVILQSSEPILSPSWSPDGNRLAYVSLEGKKAQIVVQDLYSGARHIVAAEEGLNNAPNWSPDGSRLVASLSRDGNPEIYSISANGGGFQRLTDHSAIDTEPVWSRDGSIYFTSDRSGSPQIYRMSASGGAATRVTHNGNYNASADVSPDGKWLTYMHSTGKGYGIAVQNLATGAVRVLSNGGKDESPSFSPNGSIVIFSNGRGGLEAISADGSMKQTLSSRGSDVREPAWSPRLP